jgi:hypothetical protein
MGKRTNSKQEDILDDQEYDRRAGKRRSADTHTLTQTMQTTSWSSARSTWASHEVEAASRV